MRESSTSLRGYFGIVGIFYFLSTGFLLAIMGPLGLSGAFGDLFAGSLLSMLNTLLGVVLSLCYIYFAFTLPSYLNPERAKYVQIFLILPPAILLLWTAIGFFTIGQINLISPAIAALITWYLYVNVGRLSKPPAPVTIR